MSALSVVTCPMTPDQYKAERALLAKNKSETDVRFQHELSRLFYRSGWTQEQLAKEEGKSQSWISYQLQFGRFWEFYTSGGVSQNPALSLLTASGFLDLWSRTEGDDRERFREVLRLVENEGIRTRQRPLIREAIRKNFADDGRFHKPHVIAAKIGTDEKRVVDCLRAAKNQSRIRLEIRRNGKYDEYRIFRIKHMIPASEIETKLKPIVEILLEQGARAPGTVSNGEISRQGTLLKELIEEWLK